MMNISDSKWEIALVLGLAIFVSSLPLEPVYSDYTWPYLWGPVNADAQDQDIGDIRQGYTPVSTLTYGALTIASIYLVHAFFRRRRIAIGLPFLISALPFVALGPVIRVLEDAEYFSEPLVYFAISPLVYVVVAGAFLGFFGISRIISTIRWKVQRLLLLGLVLATTVFYFASVADARWQDPIPIIVLGTMMSFIFLTSPSARTWQGQTFFFGFYLLFLYMLPLFHWMNAGRWSGDDVAVDRHVWVIPAVLILTAGLTAMIYLVWRYAYQKGKVFRGPIGIPLFFAQLLDGTATWIGIDHFGAWEKHPLPRYLIDQAGTAIVMIPLKMFVVLLFIFLVLGPYRKDMEKDPEMFHLIYLGVFILGFAPGLRDMLRLAMGV